ncbi:PAS domain S-box protein [Zunongwangia sp. F363]|uniref:histidine kinase n=1 Tax=Autumnicola tepida TaxID=3075595 RepID=A0ABU3CA33_9FLAO|nr:PAS domain S-box protein [Zunongwangia sp. F363]MDT0643191.1 PAS domain S-box protein [Zunongwangia sp. F363]
MLKYKSDYQSIFDLAPFPMWIYNFEDFRFLAVNKEAINHYGYSEKEFLNMTIKDIRPKEEISKLEKAVKEAKTRTNLYKESIFRHQKRNGQLMHVQIKSKLIDFQGKKCEIVTSIDLTDRYEKEQKIKTQKNYLIGLSSINQLLLKSDEWIQSLKACFKIVGETVDIDRIYLFQNNLNDKTSSQRLEWSRINSPIEYPKIQNIAFSQFQSLMEPLKQKRFSEAIVAELPISKIKDFLLQHKIKSFIAMPLWVHDIFWGFIGFGDCSKTRKFSEDEVQFLNTLTANLGHVIKQQEVYLKLTYSEARFKSLIKNGKDLIAIVDKEGIYKYVAPTSSSILGSSPEKFIGKNAFDYIHELDISRLKIKFEEILESMQISIEPYRFKHADGNWRWVRTELSNHLNTPNINGIVANSHDVTTEVKKKQIDELSAALILSIGQPGTLISSLKEGLNKIGKLDKINVSEIWLISEDNIRLDLIAFSSHNKQFNAFNQRSKEFTSFSKGIGLPGHIWNENSPLMWKDISNNKLFYRSEGAKVSNLNTGIGFPIIYNNKFIGCIICFSTYHGDELSEELHLLTEVTQQLGPVIKQKITENEYRNFFNISPDPHCIIGFDGYIKKFNHAFQSLLGYDETVLLTTPIFQFIHSQDKQESQNRLKLSIQSNSTEPFEARFITCKGAIKWLIWNGTLVSESKIIVAVAKDITDQRLAKEELQVAYERLETAQKIAKLGYWVRDFGSDVSVWNDETYSIYEYSPQNFIPTMENVTKTFHPDDRYLIESDPGEHLEAGKVQSFEHRILTGKGKTKWVHQEIRLLTDDHGVPFRIEGTVQDITQRKEYEEQLYLSNERFRLAMQASNELIWEIDHLNQIIFRGKNYELNFHYEKKEVFSKNNYWFERIHPEDRDEVWTTLNNTLNNKEETFWRSEYRIQSKDGFISYFIDRCHILRDVKGNPLRSVGSALDVTTSRQHLERIKKQNEKLRDIAWLQSHVVREPLTRIMGLVYLANEINREGEPTKEIMEMITESANELDDVIREINDSTKMIKNQE